MKIAIWGAGGTGGTLAQELYRSGSCDIALIDVNSDLAIGKALDIAQTASIWHTDSRICGGDAVQLSRGSDVIVITAGIGRRPGLKREDLLLKNAEIALQIASEIRVSSPAAWVIVLTNPADLLARVLVECGGLPRQRVMAQGGILDSARLASLTAAILGCSARDVQAMVLGTHGDDMVPLRHGVSLRGMDAAAWLDESTWHGLVERTRSGGGEILAKFGHHGAFVTPAAAVLEIIQALAAPIPRILPISIAADGAYGLPPDVFIGLPVLLGQEGVMRTFQAPLLPAEAQALTAAAQRLDDQFKSWQTQVVAP